MTINEDHAIKALEDTLKAGGVLEIVFPGVSFRVGPDLGWLLLETLREAKMREAGINTLDKKW